MAASRGGTPTRLPGSPDSEYPVCGRLAPVRRCRRPGHAVSVRAGRSPGFSGGCLEPIPWVHSNRLEQDLLLALLQDDSAALDAELEAITSTSSSGVDRVRRFAQAMLARGDDPARVQVRADLWADLLTEDVVRERLAAVTARRRQLVRGWIEEGTASGELVAIPANAPASILLALTDGLMLHGALDPGGFRWPNIRRAIDVVLEGIAAR